MTEEDWHLFDVLVIGAGAAGVGVGVALKHAGIDNFLILDRYQVGASFERWPEETQFITPSFPTNSIGMLDLNSVAIGVSPAYSLGVEHPTGKEFAAHLCSVAAVFELPVCKDAEVLQVKRFDDCFLVETAEDTLRSKLVIWAAGEFQYPQTKPFPGAELCRHTATIPSYENLDGDDFIVIGGYESGVDAAYHLSCYDKRVRLLDSGCPWEDETSEPSVALSTFSLERMQAEWFETQTELIPHCPVSKVLRDGDKYQVHAAGGLLFESRSAPLLAIGFEGSLRLVSDLFEKREDGYPLLSEQDESTVTPGLFLCGPAVRHDHHVFCYIYKYRQRFSVVAKAIATQLGLPAEELENYRKWGMYLDDLSCCGEECVC